MLNTTAAPPRPYCAATASTLFRAKGPLSHAPAALQTALRTTAAIENPDTNPAEAFQLNQNQLAEMAGTSRVLVNRTLHNLSESGVISVGYGRLQIHDVRRLMAFAYAEKLE
jgi:CRP-like cAMP-binding protein